MCPWKRPQSSAQRIVEAPDLGRADVGDVVDARVGVGFHAEVARPERMDHVERGDVKLNVPVDRQLEVRRLHAAERREAVGERPTAARSPAPGAGGSHPASRSGPRPARRRSPSLEQPDRCRRRRRRARSPAVTTSQVDHDPAVATNRDCLLRAGVAPAKDDQRVGEEDDHERCDRRHDSEQDRVVRHLRGGRAGAVARRQSWGGHQDHDGRRDDAQHGPEDQDSSEVAGLDIRRLRSRVGSRPCSRSSASAPESVDESGRAGHEALPAIAPRLAGADREGDGLVGLSSEQGISAHWLRGVAPRPSIGTRSPSAAPRRCARKPSAGCTSMGFPLTRMLPPDRPLHLGEERVAQTTLAVEVVGS